MYKLILAGNNVIGSSKNLIYLENGMVGVSEYRRYAESAYDFIVEVPDIPDDYEDFKYDYEASKGFTINPNWCEPEKIVDPIELSRDNEVLKKRIQEQEQAIMELTALLSGGGVNV